ncbi:MAG: NRDE family protein [Bacteroidales bacterium]|nr:NRDE family protein [Bacteroidales bacterium]
MCTLTFFPQGNGFFCMTQSRDESIRRRPAIPPMIADISGRKHIFPADGEKGGTWIGVSADGRAASLLNGSEFAHPVKPPFRHSRGLLIPALFSFPDIRVFAREYAFGGLEPFTMVVREAAGLYELSWNGLEHRLLELDPDQARIYSSPTLYDDDIRITRRRWFDRMIADHPGFRPGDIWQLHVMGQPPGLNGNLLIQREDFIETVSISQITRGADGIFFKYKDLINQITFTKSFSDNADSTQAA